MKNYLPFIKASVALAALMFVAAPTARAQATYTGSYSQNFDGLGTSGLTAPTGWTTTSETGTHDTFSPVANPMGTGENPDLTAGALSALTATLTSAGAAGTQKGTGAYNFGTLSTSTDRALGTSPSGNAATILELSLTNSTGSAINTLALSYDIDRFTTTTANNTAYAASPTVGVEENPGYWLYYSLNNGSTWINVSSLDPTLAGTSGVVVPNTVGVTSVNDPLLTLGSSWAAGSKLEFAWVDDNAQSPSPDQLIGLNNVVVGTAVATPEPSSVALSLIAGLAFAVAFWRRCGAV